MTLRRHILVLLAALFGLLAPTFTAGANALAAGMAPAAVTALDDGNGPTVPHYKPCEKQGGKRVLPCHPDLGVLTAVEITPAFGPRTSLLATADLPYRRLVPAADPPPPRRD